MFKQIIIIGRLGQNPSAKDTKSGKAMVTFSVAVQDLNEQRTTTWYNIIAFGKTAENCMKFLSKGSVVQCVGKPEVSLYQDKSGMTKIQQTIIAETVTFLQKPQQQNEQVQTPAPQRSYTYSDNCLANTGFNPDDFDEMDYF